MIMSDFLITGLLAPDCDNDWLKCTNYYVLGVHLEDIFFGLRYHEGIHGSLEEMERVVRRKATWDLL